MDAVLVGAGGNDAGFSAILKRCMEPDAPVDELEPCYKGGTKNYVRRATLGLPGEYDKLDVHLSGSLRARRIYLSGYPGRIFTDRHDNHRRGCGVFGFVSRGEARWLSRQGRRLNAAVAEGARRNGWTFVPGATEGFRGRGYCSGRSWFRSFEDSRRLQADVNGTMHPVAEGHAKLAELAARTLRLDSPVPPAEQLAVTFLRVRVHDDPPEDAKTDWSSQQRRVWLGVPRYGGRYVPDDHTDIPLDRWIDLDSRYRFVFTTYGRSVGIEAALQLPSFWIEGNPDNRAEGPRDTNRGRKDKIHVVRRYFPFRIHKRVNGWDANPAFSRPPGRIHTVRAAQNGGVLEFQYRIDVIPPAGEFAPGTS